MSTPPLPSAEAILVAAREIGAFGLDQATLPLVLAALCNPATSAADVGCGVGTWLRELQSRGVEDIQGIDGPWVESSLLCIPQEKFLRANMGAGEIPTIGRRFDLAISLEVAEHLGPDLAEQFVALLTSSSRIL